MSITTPAKPRKSDLDRIDIPSSVKRDGVYIPSLSSSDMPKFQEWLFANNVRAPFHPAQHYDYVSAFKDNVNATRSAVHPNGGWPDTYKLPNHPTFSNESKYYKKGMKAVYWEGENPLPITRFIK